ncbi:MAG: hypothetical protein ABIU54_00345 [Candidatus Eisenbacteria bacterium]
MNQQAQVGVPTPWGTMRARLECEIAALEARGDAAGAASLRDTLENWWTQQMEWNARAMESLSVHHEINNALVGVRGNMQLLLMNPEVKQLGIRERLEVVLRESSRIQEAAGRLGELKAEFGGPPADSRAA